MQDRFKVGDKLIFRRGMHKVADMLNTSFYDVLTSVYDIIGTEGRCYLMKSEKSSGRVWKIRKSRIDGLGTKVVFTDSGVRLTDDGQQGFRLVPKSAIKREKRRSPDLFEEALSPDVNGYLEEAEHLLLERAKEYVEVQAKAREKPMRPTKRELADAFVRSAEKIMKEAPFMMKTFFRLYEYDGSDWIGFREHSAYDETGINKLKGGEE